MICNKYEFYFKNTHVKYIYIHILFSKFLLTIYSINRYSPGPDCES